MKNFNGKEPVQEKQRSPMWLFNALFWAAVILIGSWLSRDSANANALYFIILTGSTMAFLGIDQRLKNK